MATYSSFLSLFPIPSQSILTFELDSTMFCCRLAVLSEHEKNAFIAHVNESNPVGSASSRMHQAVQIGHKVMMDHKEDPIDVELSDSGLPMEYDEMHHELTESDAERLAEVEEYLEEGLHDRLIQGQRAGKAEATNEAAAAGEEGEDEIGKEEGEGAGESEEKKPATANEEDTTFVSTTPPGKVLLQSEVDPSKVDKEMVFMFIKPAGHDPADWPSEEETEKRDNMTKEEREAALEKEMELAKQVQDIRAFEPAPDEEKDEKLYETTPYYIGEQELEMTEEGRLMMAPDDMDQASYNPAIYEDQPPELSSGWRSYKLAPVLENRVRPLY